MKSLLWCLTLVSAVFTVSGPVSAQDINPQTAYVVCFIHYGDQGKPTEVSPVTKVTMPLLPPGTKFPNMQFTLSADFRSHLLSGGARFYKSGCLDGNDPALVRKKLALMENTSGYGSRERRELGADQFWPPFLDYVFKRQKQMYPSIDRGAYSYIVKESAAK